MSEKHQTPSDRLPPHLPAIPRREKLRTAVFGGLTLPPPHLDVRAGAAGGEALAVAAAENISPRAYPALATRLPHELLVNSRGLSTPNGMAVMGGVLYFAQGDTLFRMVGGVHAGTPEGQMSAAISMVGRVADCPKQMAVFGGRLLIFPDKLYVDAADGALHPMELDSGIIPGVIFSGNTVTLPAGRTWRMLGFGAGDGIHIFNRDDVTPAPEGEYRITRVQGQVAYMANTFSSTYESQVQIKREVPALTRLCVSGDRVFGTAGQEIRISAAGTPFCWIPYRTEGVIDGRSGATVKTDTEGDLTACAAWQGYVVFFKADRICRLLGSRADAFSVSDIAAPGIPADMADTLCEVGGALYYYGDSGAYRYGERGLYPERLGCLSLSTPIKGRAASDGLSWYLSLAERDVQGQPKWRTYVYVPDTNAWFAEDTRPISSMCRLESYVCRQNTDGHIWLCRSDGRRAGRAVDEADVYGPIASSVTFGCDKSFEPDGYRPTAVYIRATSEPGGELQVLGAVSDGAYCPAGTPDITDYRVLAAFAGGMTDRLLYVPLLPAACNGMTLRLEMTGDWIIHAVTRVYEVPRA